MKATHAILLTVLTGAAFSSAFALDATSADNLASAILTDLGRTKGVVSIPNCGNGQLARAFVQRSGMKVHAMDSDTANLRVTHQLMESIGATAPACYVDKGSLSLMPYADRFVDCIAITNLTDANLAGIPYAEIERALCPGGHGWIGRASAEGAGITQAALQSWINAAAKAHSTAVVSTTQGTWAVITRAELSGVDTWPRRAYDAAGSRSSGDSVASFPWLPQARIKPYNHGQGSLVASGGRMYMAFPDYNVSGSANWVRAYNIYNGELLWQRDLALDGVTSLTSDFMTAAPWGLYIAGASGTVQLDGNTGAVVSPQTAIPADRPGPAFSGAGNGYGCGPYTASTKLLYKQMYAFGYDRVNNRALICHSYKAPCQTGVSVSNGFAIFPANHCGCNFTPGTMLEAPAGSFIFDRAAAADGSDRLEKGPAWNAVSAVVVPDASDWPTYRANNSRSGVSAANVPATTTAPPLMWNCRPARNYVTAATSMFFDYLPEQAPTAPVVAGQYTFIGGSDGYVRCIDNAQGLLKWSYPTGGRIFAAPTVAQGCVYVGSGDGWAYCLEAHTGRLVWRFRAAPVDRRFNLYGYLSSTWPVIGGVVVQAGKAYFCGGLQSEYGTHVYCVDALSGSLVWQNNSSGTSYIASGRLGFSPEGPMAVLGAKLVANSAAAPMAAFSMANGAQDPTPASWPMTGATPTGYSFGWASFAREIGVLDNSHVFKGGLWCFSDFRDRQGGWQKAKSFFFNQVDGSGNIVYPQVSLAMAMWTCPAWDGQDFFATIDNSKSLIRASVSGVASAVDATVAANAGVISPDANASPTAQWTRAGVCINAIALSPAGIAAVYAKTNLDVGSVSPTPESVAWYVGVLNRSTGATVWEAALPDAGAGLKGEPLIQGLAIDRIGNIIVAQRNGNVLCYGNGAVSVVARDLVTPPATPLLVTERPLASSWTSATATVAEPARQVSPNRELQASAVSAQASVQTVATVFDAPAAAAPAYDPTRDSSDMKVVSGVFQHTVSPDQRGLNASYKPRDMRWQPQQACLAIVSARASSSSKTNGPQCSIDRSLSSRWQPAAAGKQWIVYDLGSVQTVQAVTLVWYAARHSNTAFALESSLDGKQFSQVDAGVLTGRGTSTTLRTFMPQEARYVRVVLDSPVSLYEVGVHGLASNACSRM